MRCIIRRIWGSHGEYRDAHPLQPSLIKRLNRKTYQIGVKVRARILTTVPDSTSQKFVIVGQIGKKDEKNGQGRVVTVFLDFAGTRTRQCEDADFDSWYARGAGHECLMGHKVRSIPR